ncbi:MAG: hypothetical protein GEU80_03170 [Dehalococcoidia bacterium]|nr:hypothetical protein [Dehalococcoidia bacterium]
MIDAVEDGDADALAALMRLHEVACTSVEGLGSGPKCWAGGGVEETVPDGTVVQSFPMSACELGWQPSVEAVVESLALPASLFAVVTFADPPLDESFLPRPDTGVIFGIDSDDGPVGMMLLMEGASVVYVDHVCIGPPELFLDDHPRYTDAQVILRAPSSGPSVTATPSPTSTPRS